MAYASACDVAALTLNLLDSSASFDANTKPTSTQVSTWLTTGCALIESQIGEHGYGAIPASSAAYSLAQQANAAYAAWWAERSRSAARTADVKSTRADMFKSDFETLMKILGTLDLSRLGVAQTSQVYGGGISRADKQAVESDTDRVEARFRTGQFQNPLASHPTVAGS